MGIREQLHPIAQVWRTYLPPACHTMSTKEKKRFLSLSTEFVSPTRIIFKYQELCIRQRFQIGWLEVS